GRNGLACWPPRPVFDIQGLLEDNDSRGLVNHWSKVLGVPS
ncbi:hypothetical protein Q604_UNBC06439G0001, partial [human gut metagenome]